VPLLNSPRPIRSVLIANRGEIALRVMRTCARLGIRTIAVYSDADADALHVKCADEAVRIGLPPARASYLDVSAILAAAKQTGADAIHPGYGFLSENAGFVRACDAAGVIFVGPALVAVEKMGSKIESKRIAEAADVPTVPGYHGDAQDDATLTQAAAKIGFPVLIKASAGGGGRGMRRVDSAADFVTAIVRCCWRNSSSIRAISKCNSPAIAMATSCICSSGIARSSATIRKCSRKRRRRTCLQVSGRSFMTLP
jgi:acetyl/propionyl-CoA carboxylase alpha subunit